MQGVWLTNTDSKVLHSRQNITDACLHLRRLGCDTIYPVVWQRGYTLYPSLVAQKYTGQLHLPQSAYSGRDCLAEIIEIAHALELRVIAWWEYGLMLPPNCELARSNLHYLSLTNNGEQHRRQTVSGQLDPCVWLNPSLPEVTAMMGELVSDLVGRYAIDGIQFDDHWAWPVELGFEPTTQAVYRQSQTGIWPFGQHPTWADWASDRLTNCFQQVVAQVKAARADCLVSLAPNPLQFSINRYHLNWRQWLELGLIDELVVQVYRYNLSSFQAELNKPELQAFKDRVSIGILTGLMGREQPQELLDQQIAAVKSAGFQGFVCFFYETAIKYLHGLDNKG